MTCYNEKLLQNILLSILLYQYMLVLQNSYLTIYKIVYFLHTKVIYIFRFIPFIPV